MVSKYFESIPYRLNEETGLIDYDECEKFALRIRPKILIAGTSAYSRLIDYSRMREIADKCGAYLLADMAHISGLVVGGAIPSPFERLRVIDIESSCSTLICSFLLSHFDSVFACD